MSLFDRITNLAKASIHEVLNKLEDPVLMTGQYLRNMEEDIRTSENAIKERQMTANIQDKKSADLTQLAKQSELRALAALESGDDTTARHAAAEKIRCEEQAQQHAAAARAAREHVAELELRLQEGKDEYDRLKEKRNELAARARKVNEHAKTQRPNFSRGVENGTAARGFERMEEKILGWEASEQVRSGSAFGNGINPGADAAMAEESLAVNAELQRLKEQLSSRQS